jgi:hypothetical protein
VGKKKIYRAWRGPKHRPPPKGTTHNGVDTAYPSAVASVEAGAVAVGVVEATRFLSLRRGLIEQYVEAVTYDPVRLVHEQQT